MLSFLPEEEPSDEAVGAGLLVGLETTLEALNWLPEDLMHRYRVLPLAVEDNLMRLAMVDPGDVIAIDDVRLITGFDIEPVQVDPAVVEAALRRPCGQPRTFSEAVARGRLFPIRRLKMEAVLSGPVASVEVSQHFANHHDLPIEAVYLFPLPHGAAVHEFRMKIGERVVEGQVEEKHRARRTYDEGLRDGHRAALLEQTAPGVFRARVGNLGPKEDVSIQFRYAQRLEVNDAETVFRFPLVVAPRYKADVELPRSRLDAALELSVELETGGLMPTRLACSQHAMVVSRGEAGTLKLELAREGELLNRDFVLRLGAETQQPRGVLLTDEDHFLMCVQPPVAVDPIDTPRDVVLLVDRSGSMAGAKLAGAKQAVAGFLRGLGPDDRFALAAFDHHMGYFKKGALSSPSEDLGPALDWLEGLRAEGGTEMLEAFRFLLEFQPREGRLLCCVLITDGQVGNEAEIYRLVAGHPARIFTLGIDTAVHEAFLRELARQGRGGCELLTPGESLEEALTRLSRHTRTAVATDLRLVDRGLNLLPESTVPPNIPDLFASHPVVVSGRKLSRGSVELTGRLRGLVDWSLRLCPALSNNPAIGVLWALDRIQELEDRLRLDCADREATVREILGLALRYNLLTAYTSFVLVDRSEVVVRSQATGVQPVEETVKDISAQDFGPLDEEDEELALDALRTLVDEAPIVRVVNLIISQAIKDSASHVHIESGRVRFRVDGVLHEVMSPPGHIHRAIVARLKLMAGLDVAEEKAVQHGRLSLQHDGQDYEASVSVCPTTKAEKVVLTFESPTVPDWSDLGPAGPALAEALERPHGLVLVAGAAHSGLGETLRACARRLHEHHRSVMVTDGRCPGGQDLEAIVHTQPGGDFRWLLEQARSGFLVVAALTADDAPDAVRRALEMGAHAGDLRLVVAQARLRLACERCPTGCDHCRMTGFSGQATLHDILAVTDEVREALRRGESPARFRQASFVSQAAELLAGRRTTLEEVRRVLG